MKIDEMSTRKRKMYSDEAQRALYDSLVPRLSGFDEGLNELCVASFRWESRFPVIGC